MSTYVSPGIGNLSGFVLNHAGYYVVNDYMEYHYDFIPHSFLPISVGQVTL